MQQIRGLTPTTPVTPVLLDSAALAAKLTAINDSETNHQAVADEGSLFIRMGLLPAGSSLEKLETDLDAGQVVGFYDPVSKGLYVLSTNGGVGPEEKFIFSHEYTHALQDQAFGLDRLATDTADQGDRDLARTALAEGDATLVMTQWAATGLTPAELIAIAGQSMTSGQQAQLDAAPAILRDTLLFPYDAGLTFVEALYAQGGWTAVNQVYSKPPDSTSQVLHPDLYAQGVEPVTVHVPAVPSALAGWKLTMQDTLGELQLGTWLATGTAALVQADARSAVAAWAGDRVGLYDGPSGEWAVVVHTAWRTSAGRDAFETAAGTMLAGLGPEYRVCGAGLDVEIALASSSALIPEFIDCNTMG